MSPHDYALLAEEAYSAAPDIGKADSASRAIVRHTADGLVIAFPGSDNAACWLTDFDVRTVDVKGAGKIHAGFWSAWKAISAPVLAAINGQPVTFVGHSLGGALSLCAAAETTLAGHPPLSAWGFEPPRISPDLGVRTLLAKIPVHLFKFGSDPVPDVPFGWHQAALLTHIGPPDTLMPRIEDHALSRIIAALA